MHYQSMTSVASTQFVSGGPDRFLRDYGPFLAPALTQIFKHF